MECGSFRLVDLYLNHLAMLDLNVSQATQILNIYGFVGITPQVQALFKIPFLAIFCLTHQEEVCPGGTKPMLVPMSSCAYHVFKVTFLAFFLPDMNTRRGVAIYMYL